MLPITASAHEIRGVDALGFAFSPPDKGAHAPNDFFRPSSLAEKLRAWPPMLAELGRLIPNDVVAAQLA